MGGTGKGWPQGEFWALPEGGASLPQDFSAHMVLTSRKGRRDQGVEWRPTHPLDQVCPVCGLFNGVKAPLVINYSIIAQVFERLIHVGPS